MRILLCSHVFSPSIGGVETVSGILANEFARLGSAVTVVTHSIGSAASAPYEVVRRPSARKLRSLARNSDIILQCQISLRTLLPLIFSAKPTFIAHHGWLTRNSGRRGLRDFFKLAVLRWHHNIAVSEALAADLPIHCDVIADPFESAEFQDVGTHCRSMDIVFMGRLVSDKGCDLVIRALGLLKAGSICPSLTIIGDGPELPALQQLVVELGLSAQVSFRGTLQKGRGREVAWHQIMAVPSICREGFGIVALEGIAAGCAIVASRSGGLPEAVGPCGIFFPRGDVQALASALKDLLCNSTLRDELTSARGRHLQRFQPGIIAARYLELFESAMACEAGSDKSVSCAFESNQ